VRRNGVDHCDGDVVKVTDISTEWLPGAPAGGRGRADEVQAAFAGPARQGRLTVLARLILAVPHLVAATVMTLWVLVMAGAAWFAALFTGEVPGDLAESATGYLRYLVRVAAYVYLLTGEYPPFKLEDVEYPARLAVRPGPLNRLAVLSRIVLLIPAVLLDLAVSYGASLVMVVSWVVLLCRGTLPAPLHQVLASLLRYRIRVSAYALLLTAAYPGGLLGDDPRAVSVPGSGPPPVTGPAPMTSPAPMAGPAPTPGPDLMSGPSPLTGPVPGGYPAPAGGPGLVTGPGGGGFASVPAEDVVVRGQSMAELVGGARPAGPGPWRLVLSRPVKCLVAGVTVIGAVGFLGYSGLVLTTAYRNVRASQQAAGRADAREHVARAYLVLSGNLQAVRGRITACGHDLSCVAGQDAVAGRAFSRFGSAVAAAAVPDSAAPARTVLAQDSEQAATGFERLSTAATQSGYIAASTSLQQVISHFDTDYQQLETALGATSR
jgi:uncharacterized protein DUF4389